MLLHLLSVSSRICLTVPKFLASSKNVVDAFEQVEVEEKTEKASKQEERYMELIKFGEWMVASTEEKDIAINTEAISILLRNGMLGQLVAFAAMNTIARDPPEQEAKPQSSEASTRNQGTAFEEQMKRDNQAILRNQVIIMEKLDIKVSTASPILDVSPVQKVQALDCTKWKHYKKHHTMRLAIAFEAGMSGSDQDKAEYDKHREKRKMPATAARSGNVKTEVHFSDGVTYAKRSSIAQAAHAAKKIKTGKPTSPESLIQSSTETDESPEKAKRSNKEPKGGGGSSSHGEERVREVRRKNPNPRYAESIYDSSDTIPIDTASDYLSNLSSHSSSSDEKLCACSSEYATLSSSDFRSPVGYQTDQWESDYSDLT